MARETGAKHVVVADAGHYLQLERPALVIASIQDILQQVRCAPIERNQQP